MKEKIDELKTTLEGKLAAAHQCIDEIKSEIESCSEKTKTDVQTGIRDVKEKLEQQKKSLETARQKLETRAAEVKERIGEKVSEVKGRMAGKKEKSDINRAVARAERTEKVAEHAFDSAVAKFMEAECAAFEAVEARLEAEELMGSRTKDKPSD